MKKLLLIILLVLVGCSNNSSKGPIDIEFLEDVSEISKISLGEEVNEGKLEFTIYSITKVEENKWLLDIDIDEDSSQLLLDEYSINLVKDYKPDRVTSLILEDDSYYIIADNFPMDPDQLALLNNNTLKYFLVIEL